MKKVEDYQLEKIYGGTTTISGTIINAFSNFIKIIQEVGYSLGSGIRRISENNLCPLK